MNEASPNTSPVILPTISEYLNHHADQQGDRIWLRDRAGDEFTTWTWQQARQEAHAVAAWMEQHFGSAQHDDHGTVMGILSNNRAHWMLADMAMVCSGNVSAPLFTTMLADTAQYILDFTKARAIVVGQAANWDSIKQILPKDIEVIALPGFDPGVDHIQWNDVLKDFRGQSPSYQVDRQDLVTLPFTSGTTGLPKGVMQNHDSMLIPMQRAGESFQMKSEPRFLSYLPLAHIAERQLVWIQSMVHCGEVTFNEDLSTLARDMADTKPTFFFGAPRVWEQLHQGLLAKLGGQQALDDALAQDKEGTQQFLQAVLGLHEAEYMLTAAAPTPPALIEWYESIGITLFEGYGQSEAMGLIGNSPEHRRVGSIGKLIEGVEAKILDDGELCVKSTGLAPGYFNNPEKTAETFVDGWVHTGDKAKIDEDGFYYITGRVKDYFKTIQGKFVAPPPIEGEFAECQDVEQLCLLGRGYSKTVMIVVLSERAMQQDKGTTTQVLKDQAQRVNETIDKHARIGAVIVAAEPWTIENGMLTPTLKIKRDEVEATFGTNAEALARNAAEQGVVIIDWHGV
ncbi:MAG: AMP-binding protein [Pseudomonadota bacterium]